MVENRRDKILRQVKTLLKISLQLKEEFNTFRGAVQFFPHKDKPELFVFQIREVHLADLGRFLVSLSFLVKLEYKMVDGLSIRKRFKDLEEEYNPDKQYEDALKHVFLNIRLDPWLQEYIFSRKPANVPVFQDVVRLPRLVENLEQDLPREFPPEK